jgi:1,4-dihydroxy-2-naphthoyl-CoA hydrolase
MTPDELVSTMPYAKALGMRVTAAAPEEVRGELDWDADLCTIGGVLHGGALMTYADSMGAICAFLNLPPGAGTSTIESKTNMFRAVRSGRVAATSTPLHVGRTTIVVQTDLRNADGKRVALVTQTQAVLPPSS